MGNTSVLGNETLDIIDLGLHAYADSFIPEEKLGEPEPIYPLICTLDVKTGYIRNKVETNAQDRYNLYQYSYTSANSSVSRKHWVGFSSYIDKLLEKRKSNILEVGANDGFLSLQLEALKHKVTALDSSNFMTEICLNQGLNALNLAFSLDNISNSSLEINSFDCIIANNVFNHANNPLDFLTATKLLLKQDGFFVFEVPYWLNLVTSKHFDQIYHEHVSYFTLYSLKYLLAEVGLRIFDFDIVDYHGGSLRVVAIKNENTSLCNSTIIGYQIERELHLKLFKEETYVKFQEDIEVERSHFLSRIHQIISNSQRCPIVGVGAAAKSNTLLTYYGLNNTYIDFLTDASEFKIGKFTPLTRIPIFSDSKLTGIDNVYAIILSWNISDTLKQSIREINRKVNFIEL